MAEAPDRLFAELYPQLHRIARRELARSGAATKDSTTTLLHEAYLSMAARRGAMFAGRGQFIAYARQVMRGVIVEQARNRGARKRGRGFEVAGLEPDTLGSTQDGAMLTRLADALEALAKAEPALAELVDLKFFRGFSFVEIAASRGQSERTVQRAWERARAYLHGLVSAGPGS
jgi:RNA polymerase sigma factor (TIGR02999 family)